MGAPIMTVRQKRTFRGTMEAGRCMAPPPKDDSGPGRFKVDRLDSWKQIAAHLGKSERTVRRWQEWEGMPVHRHPHRQRGAA